MSGSSSGTSFLAGFLIGAAVGAVIGILFAPRSGRETRDLWRDRLDDARLRAMDLIDEIRDEVEDVRERAQATLEGRKQAENKPSKSE